MSTGQHERPDDGAIGRRQLLAGFVGLAGVGAVAAILDESVSSGSQRPPVGRGAGPETTLAPPPPVLDSAISAEVAKGSTTYSYVTRPDLHPPRVLLDVNKSGQDSGLIVTECHGGSGQQGPMLIGPEGRLVWFVPLSGGGSGARRAFNVRIQQYKGKPVLTYFEGAVVDGHGEGVYHILDTNYRVIKTLKGHNGLQGDLHDFLITPQDTALFTSYGQATADLSSVGGSSNGEYFFGEVQEVDIETGRLLFYWRSDRHVGFKESYDPVPKTGPWDYFHLNSINIDPLDGNIIISSRMCWAFFKLNRKTGQIMWRCGGKKSDFKVPRLAKFAWQHDVTPHQDGIYTIFDNEGAPALHHSRGLVLHLDEATKKVRLIEQFLHKPPLFSDVLGSVQDLPRHHHFVGWGTTTYFTEYDSAGRVVLDGHLDGAGLKSYRAFKSRWTGVPAEAPAVVARKEGSRTVAYVSWNGATTVAHWLVRAGSSATDMKVVGQAEKKGFETSINLPGAPTYVQLVALDGAGHPVRRSAIVKVS